MTIPHPVLFIVIYLTSYCAKLYYYNIFARVHRSDMKTLTLVLAHANADQVNCVVSHRDLRTPLHLACSMVNLPIAQLLLWVSTVEYNFVFLHTNIPYSITFFFFFCIFRSTKRTPKQLIMMVAHVYNTYEQLAEMAQHLSSKMLAH